MSILISMLKVASSRPYPRTQERVCGAGPGRGPDGAGGGHGAQTRFVAVTGKTVLKLHLTVK